MELNRIKEELSISYISALCADAAISYEISRHDDDSTDGILKKRIRKQDGGWFDAMLRIQLKCTSSSSRYAVQGGSITYKIRAKNYNDLCRFGTVPIILGLLVLPDDRNFWVQHSITDLLLRGCMYWKSFAGETPSQNKDTVSITIDKRNVINQTSLSEILEQIANGRWQ